MSRYLSPAGSMSTFTDWGISRLCLFTLRLYVTARPATRAPVTSLLLTAPSLHGDPQ